MRIVVYGTGGAGGYFGAQLALSGEQVVFIARGEHLKALRSNGLRLETPNGDTVIRPVEATDDPASVTGADVVLVGVKAWQVPDAAQALRPLIGRGRSSCHCKMASRRHRNFRPCSAQTMCWGACVGR